MRWIPSVHDSFGRSQNPGSPQQDASTSGGRETGNGVGQLGAEYRSKPHRSRGRLDFILFHHGRKFSELFLNLGIQVRL